MYETLDCLFIIHIKIYPHVHTYVSYRLRRERDSFFFLWIVDTHCQIMSSFYQCVKFDYFHFWFRHLESDEQSHEQMIIKCTNLIEEEDEDKNSDDDNQDSKKTTRENFSKKKHVFSRLIHFVTKDKIVYLKSDFSLPSF